ncbi:MAG TPA: D-hexose-6-phosphate mutarotase [Acidobacteriaceae bacterium]|nr:D-hexose-6-phosphate mutarotase [Acidobacteriaceae bacterium]
MADAAALEKQFGIPNVLRFEQSAGGLVVLHITAPSAEATIYLQGAHVTHWKPAGHDPAIFLSDRAEFVRGKPIRGGIPIVFPWFGDRHDGKQGPQHGFARISDWELAFAALSGTSEDAELHLAFTLAPNDLSRSLGFDHFRLGYRVTVGQQLRIEMSVANDSGSGSGHSTGPAAQTAHEEMERNGAPLTFEQALHTYYQVADARQVSVDGLDGTEFIDKVDNFQRKIQDPGRLRLTGRVDRPYLNTEATCVLHDPAGRRSITVAKQGSHSTVIWNPWNEFTAKMPDMQPDAWLRMTCIETANVADNAITLQPGETHVMRLTASIDKTA